MLRRLALCLLLCALAGHAAADCEEDLASVDSTKAFRTYLKQGIYAYLANPDQGIVSLNELNETLDFYLSSSGVIDNTVLCSESDADGVSSHNGVNLSRVVKTIIDSRLQYRVPKCTDGTLYGECSHTRPLFCYSGKLVHMCQGPDKTKGTDDDCQCKAGGIDNCSEEYGICGTVECTEASNCSTGPTTSVCDGNNMTYLSCGMKCENYKCVSDSDSCTVLNTEDCAENAGYPYCQDGQCVQCRDSNDCGYVCDGNNISSQMCDDNYCAQDILYKPCSPQEVCADNCGICMNKTTPKTDEWKRILNGNGYEIYLKFYELKSITGENIMPTPSWENITFYEYKDGSPADSSTETISCVSATCVHSWQRTGLEPGTYSYKAVVSAADGRQWVLPLSIYEGEEGFCGQRPTYVVP